MTADPAGPAPTGRTTTTVYDADCRPVRAADPPGVMTTTAYAFGGAPGGSVPSGNVTWATIDAQGKVIARGTGPAPDPESAGPDAAPPDEPYVVE